MSEKLMHFIHFVADTPVMWVAIAFCVLLLLPLVLCRFDRGGSSMG